MDVGDVELALAVAKAPPLRELQRLSRRLCAEIHKREGLRHGLASLARAMRLWTARPERLAQQPTGALLRQIIAVLRCYVGPMLVDRTDPALAELAWLDSLLRRKLQESSVAEFERSILAWFARHRGETAPVDGEIAPRRSDPLAAARPAPVTYAGSDTECRMVTRRW
jgi:hypothetical protein